MEKNQEVNDIEVENVIIQPEVNRPRINILHALSFFIFFLPFCNMRSKDQKLDAYYTNQGLIHFFLMLAASITAIAFSFIPVVGLIVFILMLVVDLLVVVSAFFGMIMTFNGRVYCMPLCGKIRIIK